MKITNFSDAVRLAMKGAKINQAELAQELGVTQGTVSRWLSGTAEPSVKHWLDMRNFLQRNAIGGDSEIAGGRKLVPLVGYVEQGGEIIPADDGGRSIELVEPFLEMASGVVCAEVRGEIMYPRYFNGERIYFRGGGADPATLIGRECVVELPGGKRLLRTIRPGSQPGVYMLEAWNAAPLYDIPIVWASPVEFVERRGR